MDSSATVTLGYCEEGEAGRGSRGGPSLPQSLLEAQQEGQLNLVLFIPLFYSMYPAQS